MAKAGHDYEAAKTLFLRGLTIKQISDKLSIPYDALAKFCQRRQWDKDRTKNSQILSKHVQDQFSEAAGRHLSKITGLTDKAIDALLTKDVQTLDLDALETLGKVADTFDRIARRSYGLDQQEGKITVNMAVQASPIQSQTNLSSIIDVESTSVDSKQIEDKS